MPTAQIATPEAAKIRGGDHVATSCSPDVPLSHRNSIWIRVEQRCNTTIDESSGPDSTPRRWAGADAVGAGHTAGRLDQRRQQPQIHCC
jgi:hypothetical protein